MSRPILSGPSLRSWWGPGPGSPSLSDCGGGGGGAGGDL